MFTEEGLKEVPPNGIPIKSSRRLVINKIAMENFKSYYGRLEIGPFHRRFTSIVGPNGSGKSNLIESLLFVFGKRANWMRLKSLHQLIHNSQNHSDIKKASVEVEFMDVEDQGNETIDLVGTRFTVKRTVHHTGQTNYHINDQHASLEEVTTLLKGKGIDLTNNRFLILQGEVEQISLMKPKSGDQEKPGLLEYLEDIIGSACFQEQIDQLSQQYDQLDFLRRERGDVMRIVENDLERLQPAKNKAIEFIRREKQGVQLQNIQLQVVLYKLTTQRDKLMVQTKKLEEEHRDVIRESTEKMQQNLDSVKNYQRAKASLQNNKDDLKALEVKLQKFTDEDSKVRSQMKELSEQEHRCQKRLDDIIKERKSYTEEQLEMEIMYPKEEEKMQQMLQKRDALEKEFNGLDRSHKEKTMGFIEEKKKILHLIGPRIEEKKQLEGQIEITLMKYDKLKGSGQDNQAHLQRIVESKDKATKTKAELEGVLKKIDDVVKRIELKRQEETQKESHLQEQMNQNDNEIKQVRMQMDSQQQTHTQQKEQNYVVKAIMDASVKGLLAGVIGRIGDLGWVAKEYDVAMSTAGFGGLNSILVENEDAAKRCVEFLKMNKIGRQTFISLARIRDTLQREMQQQFTGPNKSQRLFDLVNPKKEEYRVAFYKIIQNTLVCDNIEIAKDIRFRQNKYFRIVTLDGKMVENTGVMSGGGQVKRGAIYTSAQMANTSTYQGDSNVAANKQKHDQLMQHKQHLQQLMESNHSEQVNLEKEYQHIKRTFHERQRDQKDLTDQIEELSTEKERLDALMSKMGDTEEERTHIERDIEVKRKAIKKIEDGYKKEQHNIDEITDKIKSLESNELRLMKDQYESLVKEYDLLEQGVNKMRLQLGQFGKKFLKLDSEQKEQNLKLGKFDEQKQSYSNQMKQHEDSYIGTAGQLKAVQERQLELDNEFERVKKDSSKLTQLINDLKSKVNVTKEKIDDNNNGINKADSEAKSITRRIEEVRNSYRDIIKEYDFLQELDQIAGYNVQQQQQQEEGEDYTLLNISMVEEPMNISRQFEDDDAPQTYQKRRSYVVSELQHLMEYDVFQTLTSEQLERCCPIEKEITRVIVHVQAKTNESAKDTNIQDINNFKTKFFDFKDKKNQLDKVKEDVQLNKQASERLKKERYEMFMSGFNVISQRLRETYQTLTTGGDAELELVDTMDPFSEGVSFSVRPKNKSWKQMNKLSGGEKTLSSLSLIFALHYFRPTPLYFFDEVDAALDYRNVQIVGNYVKERTKNAQFIVISLRNNMFELADKLVGIYKTFDQTKSISIQPALVMQKVIQYHEEDSENSKHLININVSA